MNKFLVSKVFDGDTFEVATQWQWLNRNGNVVRPTGYDTPEEEEQGYDEAKQQLSELILSKTVEIGKAQTIDEHNRLVADVYFERKNLADYFLEYKV